MIVKEISQDKKSTAVSSKSFPIQRWYSFIAGYSPEYIYEIVNEYKSRVGKTPSSIYDPFSGCATTNVVSNFLGIESIGCERNPFFYRIGIAKCNARKVMNNLETMKLDFSRFAKSHKKCINLEDEYSTSALLFLRKLFTEKDLSIMTTIRNYVLSNTEDYQVSGFLFLSKILDTVTHSKTDGIYKAPTSVKTSKSILDAIEENYVLLKSDEEHLSKYQEKAKIIFGSSIEYKPKKASIDIVVFSPPYLNNFDFAEMTRMYMYFWGEAKDWREISEKHRNDMLINTTTALKKVRDTESQMTYRRALPIELQETLKPIVLELASLKKEKPSHKDYDLIIYPYLAQMQTVLENCYYSMKKNSSINIIVSDAAFYGIHIDTQEYLSIIMKAIGYSNVKIKLLRGRGTRWILEKRKSSGKSLGEYEINGVKE